MQLNLFRVIIFSCSNYVNAFCFLNVHSYFVKIDNSEVPRVHEFPMDSYLASFLAKLGMINRTLEVIFCLNENIGKAWHQ